MLWLAHCGMHAITACCWHVGRYLKLGHSMLVCAIKPHTEEDMITTHMDSLLARGLLTQEERAILSRSRGRIYNVSHPCSLVAPPDMCLSGLASDCLHVVRCGCQHSTQRPGCGLPTPDQGQGA